MKNQNTYLPEDILIPFFGKEKQIVGVEIGILGGSGSVAMLNRMPNLKLYCIDPWKHFGGHSYEAENPQEYHNRNYEDAKRRTKEFGERVVLLKMTSDEAMKHIKEKVDFVHIDGDHSENQVRKDIKNWKTKLKQRAILSGHDYQIDHIRKVIKEEIGEIQLGDDFLCYKIYE